MAAAQPRLARMRVLGRRLRVGRWGTAGGARPLLVFNGIGMNLELLSPIAAALAPRPVVAFDMPGVGGSPDPVVPYNAVTMAATASVLLDRLGIARADVLGISWGGGIAQQFALQHRDRTGRLVLAASSAGMIMAPGAVELLARLADPREYTAGKAMQRNLALLFNGGGAGVPVSLNAARSPSSTGWLYQLAALFGWSSLPLLPWLDVPTLVVAGEEDRVVPAVNSRLLHALIPGSRLVLFRGGGHLFMLSHLDAFAREVRGFLDADAPVESG
jgi:pimeloyl-ACP methyl ester carboxylesterase